MGKVGKRTVPKGIPKILVARKSVPVKKSRKSDGSSLGLESPNKLSPQVIQSNTDFMLKAKFVKSAVQHLLVLAKQQDNKNALFDDDKTIYLQINTVKIPKCPTKTLNIDLKHSVLPEDYDIVLITGDLKNEKKTDYQKNVDHYRAILDEQGVTCVQEIIPLHQLKASYTEYEMQNRLIGLYDMIVVDSGIDGYVKKTFGHLINKRKKLYGTVKLTKSNLKGAFERILTHSELHIHSKGDTYSMQVGHTGMDGDHVVDNIMAAAEALAAKLPGGFINVKGLFLKTAHSKAIQFYISCINSNKIKVPAVKQDKGATNIAVKGELSTQMDTHVTVLPGGDVLLKCPKTENGEIEIENDQGEKTVDLNEVIEELDQLEEVKNEEIKPKSPPKSKRGRKNTPVSETIAVSKKEDNKENEIVSVVEPTPTLETATKRRAPKMKATEEPSLLVTSTVPNTKRVLRPKKSPVEPIERNKKDAAKPKRKTKKVEEVIEKPVKGVKAKSIKTKAPKKEIDDIVDVAAPGKKKSPKRKIAQDANEPVVNQVVEKKRGRATNKN